MWIFRFCEVVLDSYGQGGRVFPFMYFTPGHVHSDCNVFSLSSLLFVGFSHGGETPGEKKVPGDLAGSLGEGGPLIRS